MLRPLTSASAPPRRSATELNRTLSSESANVCNGVSVSSIRVPSTSKNKHQSSDGGGSVCIERSLQYRCGAWARPQRIRHVIFTRNTASNIRDCAVEFRYFVKRCFAPSCCASFCRWRWRPASWRTSDCPISSGLLAEWFRSDVELRAQLVMHSMEEPITDLVEKGNESRLRSYLAKITADERLLAVLVCRTDGSTIFKTERAPPAITCDAAGNANGPAHAHRAIAVRVRADFAIRFRQRRTDAVSGADAARFEFRRPAADEPRGTSCWCSSASRCCCWRC